MRMIKPDHFQVVLARVSFTPHQLYRLDQKPVTLRTFLTRIRNRISLSDQLAVRFVTTEQQPTTFVRIVAHAVRTNLVKQLLVDPDHRACSMSAMMSSIFSMPTEMRTR